MNEILEFLTSKEIIVVYIVVAVALLLCLIIYLVDKSYDKRKRRQNTRKLNRLVEDVNLRLQEEEEKESNKRKEELKARDVPTFMEPKLEQNSITIEDDFNPTPTMESVSSNIEPEVDNMVLDNMDYREESNQAKEAVDAAMTANINRVHDKIEQIVYTNAEPDREEATRELLKLTEELEKAEQATRDGIDIESYENAQEENAIISLDELTKRSEEMYAANELTQYADEGNEPISLDDLEKRKAKVINSEIVEEESPKQEQMSFDNAYSGNKPKQSNVFSSVFGSQNRDTYQTEEELEKTSQFLLSLKELQNRLNS